jgi:multidrug efflux system outer membrane protein
MNMRTPMVFVAVALALAGCTMIPKYERPPLPVPDSFPASAGAMDDSTASAATAGSTAAATGWREYFLDERLRAVIERALENNRDLRIAALSVEQAAALYRVRRAEITPTFGIQAAGQKTWLPERMTESGNAGATEQYSVEVGFMSWEIDLFGRLRSLKKGALEQYLATEQAQRAVRTSLVAGVASSWLRLAADSECLHLAEATIAAQSASRDLVKASRDAGVASDLDLSQVESQVETARASRAEFAGAVGVDRHALELLVGSPLPDELLPRDLSVLADLPALAAGLPSEVLLARPDILAAEHRLRAANADIGAARAAFFPHISLTAALGTLSPDLSHLFASDTHSWRYAPVVQVPIFGGGGPRANLKMTNIEREIAVATYEKAIQSAFAEVADALTLRATLLEQREAWDRLLVSLEQTLSLSDARYKAGLDGYLSVLVAQRSLFSAQQAGVALRLAEKANRIALYKALGGGS